MRQINRRLPLASQLTSIQIGLNQVRRTQLIIIHAAWLDDDPPFFAVDAAGVSAVHGDEAGAENFQVGRPYLASKLFERWHRKSGDMSRRRIQQSTARKTQGGRRPPR